MAAPLIAMKAYSAAQKAMETPMAHEASAAAGPSFQNLLQSVMGDVAQSTKQAESQMASHAQGKTPLVDVVTAVSSAEASLETVMAVRDQMISAYQEIMRMGI